MATPLPLSVENATDPTCDIAIWVMFLFFSRDLMRAIIISGTRK
jgi:hypothetical protein